MNLGIKSLCMAVLMSGVVVAADQNALKIAVYDDGIIMTQSSEWKDIIMSIDLENQKRAKEIQKDQEVLQAGVASLQKQNAMMNDVAREREQTKLARLERDLRAKATAYEQDYEQERRNAAMRFIKKLEGYISEYAQANGLDMVMPKGMGVYACNKVDQTNSLVQFMNTKYDGAKKSKKVS